MAHKKVPIYAQTTGGLPPRIPAVQNDTARNIDFEIVDIDMSTITSARIYVTKPDNTEVYNDCVIAGNLVVAPLSSQTLAVKGLAIGQLQLFGTEGLLSSFDFEIDIKKSRADAGAIESSNEYTALAHLIVRAEELCTEFEEVKQKVNVLWDGNIRKYGCKKLASSSDPSMTRIWDAVGKSAAVETGNGPVHNDFDEIYPWSAIKVCNISVVDGAIVVNAYKGDVDFKTDGSNGQVAVEIPEFWSCPMEMDNDGYIYRGVSPMSIAGWHHFHKRYIGAYNAVDDAGTKLKSVGGEVPLVSVSETNFRTKARATDSLCQLWDLEDYEAVCVLFDVEFATFNCQAIMRGACDMPYNADDQISAVTDTTHITVPAAIAAKYTNGQGISIGSSKNGTQRTAWVEIVSVDTTTGEIVLKEAVANMAVGDYLSTRTWATGKADDIGVSGYFGTDGNTPCKYRGIENVYGNIYTWIDGFLQNDYQPYVCRDKSKFASSITSDYEALAYTIPTSNGYGKTLGNDPLHPWAHVTKEIGGSATTWLCDYYYQNTGLIALRAGGAWHSGSSAGLRCFNADAAPSGAYIDIGARLSWKAV